MQRASERSFYDKLKVEFEGWWREAKGEGNPNPTVVCRLTAEQHGRNGQWFAPDLVHVARREYEFWPRAEIQVTTVEFKPRLSELCIADVYEALAQRRGAHKAILVVYDDGGSESPAGGRLPSAVQRDVEEVASQEGLGFIVVRDLRESGAWDWEERVRARRARPRARWLSRLLQSSFKGKPEEAALLQVMNDPMSGLFHRRSDALGRPPQLRAVG
jgi:hypothetical protein